MCDLLLNVTIINSEHRHDYYTTRKPRVARRLGAPFVTENHIARILSTHDTTRMLFLTKADALRDGPQE